MEENLAEVIAPPIVEEAKPEFPPVRTTETRALVTKKKKESWNEKADIRGLVETRDILEFAAVRNMAATLQEASNKIADMPNLRGGYDRAQAEQVFDGAITSSDKRLSQQQVEALQRGRDTVLDSIDKFDNWKAEHTEDDVYSLLGERFSQVDRDNSKVDTSRFPGAVVIEISDANAYQATRKTNEQSLGFYGEDLGEGALKGRVLVINASQAHEDTPRHEYQHFLFTQAAKEIEFVPEVSPRKIKEEEEKTEKVYQKKKAKLEDEKLDAELAVEEEYEDHGRVFPEVSKRLSGAERKLRELPTLLATTQTAGEAKYKTYPEGPIKDAFTKFKNEFMAYTSGGGKRAHFDTYFGDKLNPAQDDPYFETFQAETDLLKGLLTLAERKGVPTNRVGYLVGSARNMQQAAKFVFLETQLSGVDATDPQKATLSEK